MMFFMKTSDVNGAPAIKGDLMSDRKKRREEKEKNAWRNSSVPMKNGPWCGAPGTVKHHG